MINVYGGYYGNGEIIAKVKYNNNLDSWNGKSWSYNGTEFHRGIEKLQNGKLVLINGYDYNAVAQVICSEEALYYILESGNLNLLNIPKFSEVQELYLKKIDKEYSNQLQLAR